MVTTSMWLRSLSHSRLMKLVAISHGHERYILIGWRRERIQSQDTIKDYVLVKQYTMMTSSVELDRILHG